MAAIFTLHDTCFSQLYEILGGALIPSPRSSVCLHRVYRLLSKSELRRRSAGRRQVAYMLGCSSLVLPYNQRLSFQAQRLNSAEPREATSFPFFPPFFTPKTRCAARPSIVKIDLSLGTISRVRAFRATSFRFPLCSHSTLRKESAFLPHCRTSRG